MDKIKVINNFLSVAENDCQKIEEFCCVQDKFTSNIRTNTKQLYDFSKRIIPSNNKALPELIINGFDEEQIWQQLELQSEGETKNLDHMSTALDIDNSFPLNLTVYETKNVEISNTKNYMEEFIDRDLGDGRIEFKDEKEELKKVKTKCSKLNKKYSIVDDKFFKLQELNEYLKKEEKKETGLPKSSGESDDESVDLFNASSDSENDKNENGPTYADFFDSPESEVENNATKLSDNEQLYNSSDSENERKEEEKTSKRVKFNLTNDSDETDSLENKNEKNEETTDVKSSFQMKLNRLNEKIKDMEEEALVEKYWTLKGEVSAADRPKDSLLEEFLEFDVGSKPAPVCTEKVTLNFNSLLQQRIKDKAFDNCQRKFKPVEAPLEYKKKLVLNQEKSKESLSQIYENEYLKQKKSMTEDSEEKQEEEPKEHIEIRKVMYSLFSKLDALSNFHYTPKMVKPDIKVISNISAISMEEVAPVASTDASLLAPEEVKAKPRGDVIGVNERTKTDMKRERRKKKMRQRTKQKVEEENKKPKPTLKAGVQKKYKRNKTDTKLIKQLSKNRNTTQTNETKIKAPKSSTAFFTQLQDQVKSHINSKRSSPAIKKNKSSLSAKMSKL